MTTNLLRILAAAMGILLLLQLPIPALQAQNERYIDPIFNTVKVEQGIQYGEAPGTFEKPTQPKKLYMDLYMPPASDTLQQRYLLIMAHGGGFLPAVEQLQPRWKFGTKRDTSLVELCERFAKRGYVVASIDYRVGWNPASGSQETREETAVQAAYRAMQDAKAAVRFFRQSAAEDGNPYRIDPTAIAFGGMQAGSQLATHMAYLDQVDEILTNPALVGSGGQPYIDTTAYANADADGNGPSGKPALGSLEGVSGNPGYSSQIQCVLSLCGGILDTNLVEGVEAREPPVIGMHGTHDDVTPDSTAFVIPAQTGVPLFKISGSWHLVRRAARVGIQDDLDTVAAYQPGAFSGTNEFPGIYRWHLAGFQPFVWYEPSSPQSEIDSARTYTDTVMMYVCPGLKAALKNAETLDRSPEAAGAGPAQSLAIRAYPNPADRRLSIQRAGRTRKLQAARLLDLTGRVVKRIEPGHRHPWLRMDVADVPNGSYLLAVETGQGTVTEQVIIQH